MKHLVVIDCGTTNSRVNVFTTDGRLVRKAGRELGVRDTAVRGTPTYLRDGLTELVKSTIGEAGIAESDLGLLISSGMITSELGLAELPHLFAPVSMTELAAGLTRVDDERRLAVDAPLYLVRGVKNAYDPEVNDVGGVGRLDFMRGEETQVAGVLKLYGGGRAQTIINLASHTKMIPIDAGDRIMGSITTMSGQAYDALTKTTIIGKSVRGPDVDDGRIDFDPAIVDLACDEVDRSGFLRTIFFPRFMDTLLRTGWRDRAAFFQAAIAADDLKALSNFSRLGFDYGERFILVGPSERCALWTCLLKRRLRAGCEILSIDEKDRIDELAVAGAFDLAKRAGLTPA